MNKDKIINTLRSIIRELENKDFHTSLLYRGEISHLIRAGRNQISLNVGEEGSRFFIDLQAGKRIVSGSITAKADDTARILSFIEKLSYTLKLVPEVPHLSDPHEKAQNIINEEADDRLKYFDSAIAVTFFKNAFDKFKKFNIEVSGAFSVGFHNYAIASTTSPAPSYYEGTDYNIELVLQMLNDDKKELRVSQVGACLNDYKPQKMFNHLLKLIKTKKETKRTSIPSGEYDVIFHADALAEIISYMVHLSLSGSRWLYQTGMLRRGHHDPCTKIFSEKFHLTDNPNDNEVLFHRKFGINGIEKPNFTPFDKGVLTDFYHSEKETSDKFELKLNNCQQIQGLKLAAGNGPSSFEQIIGTTQKKTLYIPYIHYMNCTNPAKGEFTGTSRFGTFLIDKGQIVSHLHNLRINDSFHHILNNIDWLSSRLEHVNQSHTYGMRLAESITCPRYIRINNVKISGSNESSKD